LAAGVFAGAVEAAGACAHRAPLARVTINKLLVNVIAITWLYLPCAAAAGWAVATGTSRLKYVVAVHDATTVSDGA